MVSPRAFTQRCGDCRITRAWVAVEGSGSSAKKWYRLVAINATV